MSEYRIGECRVTSIDDGMDIEPPFYKVFLVTEDGDWWFEAEFDSIEEANAFIDISEKYPDKTVMERAIMAEEGEE